MTTGCEIDRKKHLTGSKVSGSGRVMGHLLTQKIQERKRVFEAGEQGQRF